MRRSTKCPECGEQTLYQHHRAETFPFDTGLPGVVLQCEAVNVLINVCTSCGRETSGPGAASQRSTGVIQALINELRHQIEQSRHQPGADDDREKIQEGDYRYYRPADGGGGPG